MSGFGWEGGASASGMLQLQGGVPLDTTLRPVTDMVGTVSPLQLSTNLVATSKGLRIGAIGPGIYNASVFPGLAVYFQDATQEWNVSVFHSGTINGTNGVIHRFLNQRGFNPSTPQQILAGDNAFREQVSSYSSLGAFAFSYSVRSVNYIVDSTEVNAPDVIQSFNTSPVLSRTSLHILPQGVIIGRQDAANYLTTASVRLDVIGDGVNNVARFQNSLNQNVVSITNAGTLTFGTQTPFVGISSANNTGATSITGPTLRLFSNISVTAGYGVNIASVNGSLSYTSGTGGALNIFDNFAAAAGNGNFRPINVSYTINNSGAQTGTTTGIFLNATETALNGMTHNLIDLQVAGSSRFRVRNDGSIFTTGSYYGTFQFGRVGFSFVNFNGNGIILLNNASETDFNRLQLGGTTNAFPAIKRNGVGIQIRRADDSGYSDLEASTILAAAGIVYMNTTGNVFIIRGTGSPEGVQAASVGSLYMRTDGGANTTLYVKESGIGNTGWVAK